MKLGYFAFDNNADTLGEIFEEIEQLSYRDVEYDKFASILDYESQASRHLKKSIFIILKALVTSP